MADQTLEEHQRAVEAFGGRIGSPSRSSLEELNKTVLGSVKELPTSGVVPISPAPLTLAEMVVSQPIAVDVSFSYPNLTVGNAPPAGSLGVGDGFVQITWGVKGGTKQVAKVDGNFGWRYPFVASQLLVQYFPVDTESNAGRIIPVNQARDLQILGLIAPASGAPCLPLTKTVRFSDIALGFAEQQLVPDWASEWFAEVITNEATTWDVGFFNPAFLQLSFATANGVAGEFPNWQLPSLWRPVPQDGAIVSLGVDPGAPVGLIEPAVKFRLAL